MEEIASLELAACHFSLPKCQYLKINGLQKCDFHGLANLMLNSPVLESLFITSKVYRFARQESGALPNMEIKCPQQRLKTVKILYDVGWDEECKLVQFILENAYFLEKMIIHADIKEERCCSSELLLLKFTRKLLLSLPRASKDAVVLVHGFPF